MGYCRKVKFLRRQESHDMKNIFLNSVVILSCTFFLGCKTDNVEGIILEKNLIVHQNYSENRRMVSLIKSSLNKDSNSIKDLIDFPHGVGESGYNLGYIITQIIYSLGEQEVIVMSKNYSKKELNNLQSYINVGLEYGDNDYDGKMDETHLKEEFPKLLKYINERTE